MGKETVLGYHGGKEPGKSGTLFGKTRLMFTMTLGFVEEQGFFQCNR